MQVKISRMVGFFFFRFAVMIGLGAPFVLAVADRSDNRAGHPFPLSTRRLAIIEQTVDEVVADIGFKGRLQAEILERAAARVVAAGIDCRLRPTSDLITIEALREAAQRRAEREVDREIPPSDADAVDREAAELYPLLADGDPVELFFMPNPARQLTVKGTFQGFDGQSLVVNRQRYPVEAVKILNPPAADPMLLIDAERNAAMRRQYKERIALNYRRQRSELLDRKSRDYMRRELAAAIKKNEASGYIFHHRQWQTLQDVITFEVTKRHDDWLQEKRAAELEAKRKAEEEAARLAAEEAAGRIDMHPDMQPPPDDFPGRENGGLIPPADGRQPPARGDGFVPPLPPGPPPQPMPPATNDPPPGFRPARPTEE